LWNAALTNITDTARLALGELDVLPALCPANIEPLDGHRPLALPVDGVEGRSLRPLTEDATDDPTPIAETRP